MRQMVLEMIVVVLACVLSGAALHGNNGSKIDPQKTEKLAFAVSVVPARSASSGRGISMAANTLDTFYVLLTNVSA
jgi:hypothetical protein